MVLGTRRTNGLKAPHVPCVGLLPKGEGFRHAGTTSLNFIRQFRVMCLYHLCVCVISDICTSVCAFTSGFWMYFIYLTTDTYTLCMETILFIPATIHGWMIHIYIYVYVRIYVYIHVIQDYIDILHTSHMHNKARYPASPARWTPA